MLFIEHVAPSDLQRKRHTVIECIPIPRAEAAQSVGYFKKALLEGDEEWSDPTSALSPAPFISPY